MHEFRVAVAFVLVLGLAGCGSDQATVMPDVIGQTLDVALSDIERAGFGDEVEVLGGGVFGIRDKSNWQVCDQSPAAGQVVTAAPRLTVDRSCGDGAAEPSEAASEAPIQEPVESQPGEAETQAEAEEILTEENNEDLAALLAVEDYDLSEEFAGKYEGKLIEFDGNIADMANHDDYDTRYDMLIYVGDYSETTATGPSFKFEDVNVSDLNLTGSNSPDYVGMGDNLHIIARVEEFNSDTGIFLLDPVSTEVR